MRLVRSLFVLAFSLLITGLQPSGIGQSQDPETYTLYLPIIQLDSNYDPTIQTYIQQVQPDRLLAFTDNLVTNFSPRHHLYNQIFTSSSCELGGPTNSQNNLLRSLADTKDRFIQLGYQVTLETIPVAYGGGYNIVAHKPPLHPEPFETILEVGAHIDAWKYPDQRISTPGASDNAVSVAGLLEMAALLVDYPNRHPWNFVVFVMEENGRWGSKIHASNVKSQPFKAALVLDGIGWTESQPEFMNCLWGFSDDPESIRLAELFDQVRQVYQIPIGWRRCSSALQSSDHFSYHELNLPAVLSIGGMPYGGPNYHACGDNMLNLDLVNALLTIQENIGVLLTLDKEP